MICYPSLCLCAQGRFLFLNAPTIFLEVNTRMPNAKVLSEKQAIVVRDKDGQLGEKVEELKLIKDRYPILGIPLIRGTVNFLAAMVSGSCEKTAKSASLPTFSEPTRWSMPTIWAG